jgi:hypothetical protein
MGGRGRAEAMGRRLPGDVATLVAYMSAKATT